ncbi:hypothetical protein EB001_18450, partial [bacterium]|nr:hypothetical protein [bacterium]
ADITDGVITSASISDGTIVNADISSTAAITLNKLSGNPNFRNIVINGDMQIAQRSISKASITNGDYHTLDRWYLAYSSLGTWTMSQSTDVPSGYGFAKSLKLDCTTANASPSASSLIALQYFTEGQNLQYLKKGTANAQSLTLSFWVKSTKTGTFIVELGDNDNTRSISKSYTVSASNTWEFKTITYSGDTTGALDNDNARSLDLNFWLGAGTNFTSGTLATSWGTQTTANRAVGQVNIADNTVNDFLITGVQLEAGTSATDFEFLPYDVSLARCQRYYYKRISTDAYGPLAQGMQVGASNMMIQGYHPVTMRASPTMSTSGTWNYETGTTSGSWSMGSQRTNPNAWSSESSITATDGSASIIYASNDTTAALIGSVEL